MKRKAKADMNTATIMMATITNMHGNGLGMMGSQMGM